MTEKLSKKRTREPQSLEEDRIFGDGQYEKRLIHDYILNNEEIPIPQIKVISHNKPLKRSLTEIKKGILELFFSQGSPDIYLNEGLLMLFMENPVFPKKNKGHKQYSEDALLIFKEFFETLFDASYISKFIEPLGAITKADKDYLIQKKIFREYSFSNARFHEGAYSLSSYYNRYDDGELGYARRAFRVKDTDSKYYVCSYCNYSFDLSCRVYNEGVKFQLFYPPYFTVFENSLKDFSQTIWENFKDGHS